MTRQFFTVHPSQPGLEIMIVQGESGYQAITKITEVQKTYFNDVNNNTANDLEVAVCCSMFGWDIPKAKELSCTPKMINAKEYTYKGWDVCRSEFEFDKWFITITDKYFSHKADFDSLKESLAWIDVNPVENFS